MDLGWLVHRYPEIAHLPAGERRSLVQAASWRVLRDVRHWLLATLPGVFMMAGLWAMMRSPTMRTSGLVGVGTLVLFLAAQLASFRYHSHAVRRTIRDELFRRGVRPACCFDCGYDLRAVGSDRCPECGTPIPATPA